jgi:hypothetical protein
MSLRDKANSLSLDQAAPFITHVGDTNVRRKQRYRIITLQFVIYIAAIKGFESGTALTLVSHIIAYVAYSENKLKVQDTSGTYKARIP